MEHGTFLFIFLREHGEILRFHCRIVSPKVSCNVCMCFDTIYVRCWKMCVVCSKVNFITNITNSTIIHTFYFYNNKHIVINTDTTFTTKHINFIKINTNPMAGPKCSLRTWYFCKFDFSSILVCDIGKRGL